MADQVFTIRKSGTITSITVGDTASYHEPTQKKDLQSPRAEEVFELVQEQIEPVEPDPAVLKAANDDLRRRNIKSK